MNTSISNKSSEIILSSAFPDINIVSGAEYCMIAVHYNSQNLLYGKFFTYNSQITLRNLAELFELFMRKKGHSYFVFNISVYENDNTTPSDSTSYSVLYCDRVIDMEDTTNFLQHNFLNLQGARRCPPSLPINVYALLQAGESSLVSVEYQAMKPNGEIFTDSLDLTVDTTVYKTEIMDISVSPDDIRQKAGDVTLLAFTVHCGMRSITCFIDDGLSDAELFIFRNEFNFIDWIAFNAVSTEKLDVDRSTAILNRSLSSYDQTVTKTYEVETGPLSLAEARSLESLLQSQDVYHAEAPSNSAKILPVIITESTSEIQNGDDKLNSVKFTWQFTDVKPRLSIPKFSDIFDANYNPAYN